MCEGINILRANYALMLEKVCPNCKILVAPKEENGLVLIKCGNCGFSEEFDGWVPHGCERCGCDKAVVLYHAVTQGDEDTTTLYQCLRCGDRSRAGWMSK